MKLNLPPEIEAIELDECRQHFARGDKAALIRAIRFCFNQEIVAPEWVVAEFFRATNKWYSLDVKELGEAFGLAWPKGANLNARKKKRRLQWAVHNAVHDARLRGRAVDDELFAEIGERLRPPIGKTLVKEYYKVASALFKMPMPAIELLLKDEVMPDHISQTKRSLRRKK